MTMEIEIPVVTAVATYLSFALMWLMGQLRDLICNALAILSPGNNDGYAPFVSGGDDFYVRRFYRRLDDVFNRPISSAPGSWIDVVDRQRAEDGVSMARTGTATKCLNIGSYNYLGFGAPDKYCTPRVVSSLEKYSASTCANRAGAGTTALHSEVETAIAEFLGKPAALLYGMGFATNSLTLPALVGKGDLVVSDALNHASIVAGARGSGARVKVFKHNDAADLEEVLRTSIAQGQPGSGKPWNKILVVVEGIYSMEGEVCNLAEIVAVKKKYHAYIYVDEAHSVGALGATGRGVCEATGVDPADVDVLMGTFTKSFGSCGGYIAASKEVIASLKHTSPAHLYATAISPPAAEQILSSLQLITGQDGSSRGQRKLAQLKDNCNWFRAQLEKSGLQVLGDHDSPVMPIMLFNPGKIAAFSRECLKRQLAVVVVGFPATPMLLSRARICISASHTRADLEYALKVINEVGDLVGVKYNASQKAVEHVKGKELPRISEAGAAPISV